MKVRSLLLTVLVLALSLGTASDSLGTGKPIKQDKREAKKEDKGGKGKAVIPQHLIQSVEQLIKAKDALRASVGKEASEKHLEASVIKQLHKAIEEVEEGIKHAELAIKKDK